MGELDERPELSVVVVVVEGEPALSRCLAALMAQEQAPSMRVLVPFDQTISWVGELAGTFPEVDFIDMGVVVEPGRRLDPFVEHALFDRRRAAGLAAAKGDLVALLEDRGAPRADWARAMVQAHTAQPAAAVGGGVLNVAPDPVRRALFVCDYGRQLPPFAEGEAEYLTDINICYRREALESVRHVWEAGYQETAVNWALRDLGQRLWLSAAPIVLYERSHAPLSHVLAERFQWGRVFGIQRGHRWSRIRALASAAAAVVLPVLLIGRQTGLLASKGARLTELLSVMGALIAVTPAWSLGEAMGYLQAKSTSR